MAWKRRVPPPSLLHFGLGISATARSSSPAQARQRKRADLSQEELSLRASLHRTEISQLERGLRIARIDTLVKVRDALEVSADDLLDGIAWRLGDYRPGGFVERGEE